MPVGCWDKSETCYAEYSEVLKDLQAKVTPNARTEEELAAIDLRYYFGHTHKRKRKTENKNVFWSLKKLYQVLLANQLHTRQQHLISMCCWLSG